MKFSEVVDQASALLQRKGRMTYRALKREFTLDDEALADLKFELITGQELAVDKDGEVLVWVGKGEAAPSPVSPPVQFQPPASYTPSHLAERIRAEQAALDVAGRAVATGRKSGHENGPVKQTDTPWRQALVNGLRRKRGLVN